MAALSPREILEQSLRAKAEHRRTLAKLPIEEKLAMVKQMIAISRSAGKLPDWYERLMSKP